MTAIVTGVTTTHSDRGGWHEGRSVNTCTSFYQSAATSSCVMTRWRGIKGKGVRWCSVTGLLLLLLLNVTRSDLLLLLLLSREEDLIWSTSETPRTCRINTFLMAFQIENSKKISSGIFTILAGPPPPTTTVYGNQSFPSETHFVMNKTGYFDMTSYSYNPIHYLSRYSTCRSNRRVKTYYIIMLDWIWLNRNLIWQQKTKPWKRIVSVGWLMNTNNNNWRFILHKKPCDIPRGTKYDFL